MCSQTYTKNGRSRSKTFWKDNIMYDDIELPHMKWTPLILIVIPAPIFTLLIHFIINYFKTFLFFENLKCYYFNNLLRFDFGILCILFSGCAQFWWDIWWCRWCFRCNTFTLTSVRWQICLVEESCKQYEVTEVHGNW